MVLCHDHIEVSETITQIHLPPNQREEKRYILVLPNCSNISPVIPAFKYYKHINLLEKYISFSSTLLLLYANSFAGFVKSNVCS